MYSDQVFTHVPRALQLNTNNFAGYLNKLTRHTLGMFQDQILRFFSEEAILEESLTRKLMNSTQGSMILRMINPMHYPQHVCDGVQ